VEQELLEQTTKGSPLNLLRWVSPRTIKETFVTQLITDTPFGRINKS
jgi:hypothetical protein